MLPQEWRFVAEVNKRPELLWHLDFSSSTQNLAPEFSHQIKSLEKYTGERKKTELKDWRIPKVLIFISF